MVVVVVVVVVMICFCWDGSAFGGCIYYRNLTPILGCGLGSRHCLIGLVTSCPFPPAGAVLRFFLSLVDFSNRTLEPAH